MTNYLLLRDNKQSGPCTFDELKDKGLKAYDLVWVEGKSAAWRYPCEIQELSAFAPRVEEQPFDRLYKKPAQDEVNNASVTPATARSASNGPVAATILTGDTSASGSPGRRIIYVTLPAGKTTPAAAPVSRPVSEPSRETPLAAGIIEDKAAQFTEDWRSTVEITPHARKKNHLGQSLLVGLTVLALLAAGIFIGLSLNKGADAGRHLSISDVKDQAPLPANRAAIAVNSLPPASAKANNSGTDTVLSATSVRTGPVNKASFPVTTAKSSVARERPGASASKPQTVPSPKKDSSLQVVPAAHREATHRSEITADKIDKDAMRNNLSNLVSIGGSGYTVGTFGGISNLQLTVSNHSIYSLNLVVVEVQYIQANKKVFKTENIYFHDIAPGSALMQEAPKSSRGIKVQYKITLVNSKELGLSYSAL
jgi:hypothetical protein